MRGGILLLVKTYVASLCPYALGYNKIVLEIPFVHDQSIFFALGHICKTPAHDVFTHFSFVSLTFNYYLAKIYADKHYLI